MPATRAWQTERELIDAVVREEAGAADRFVHQYASFIRAVLIRDMGLGRDRTDDLFQGVFERLWEDGYRRLRLWRGEGIFVSYLGAIVRRLALDRLRGTREAVGLEDAPEPSVADPGPDDLAALEEERAALYRALGELRPRDRELIVKCRLEEKSYKEIARELGMTVTNVGVALGRAEKRMTGKLEKMGFVPPRNRWRAVIRAGGIPSRP